MKRALTFIFGLILMVAPFVPTPSIAATSTPTVTVTGIVHDENNDPLPFVAVAIHDTSKGMATDTNGSFTFHNISTDATIVITHLGYKAVYIDLSEKTPTDNTINLGTITLEVDGLIEEVIISSYPRSITTPEHATQAIIYNEEIGFNPSTERDAATLTNTNTRNKRNDKNVICKCAENYILMNRNHQSFTGRITLTKSTSTPQTVSYDSQNPNGICDQESLAGATENEYLLLLATELHDAGLQCVAPTNCSSARNVTESHYGLNGTQYKCIVDECSTGYTPNAAKDGCEEVEDCKSSLTNQTGVKVATYRGNGSNRICVVTECECGYDISDDQKSCTVWNQYTCSNRTKIRGATRMQRFCDGETEVCTALECDTKNYKITEVTNHDYNLPSNISKLYICEEHAKQCTEAQRTANASNLRYASKSKPIIDTTKNDGSQICIPTKCVCGYDLTNPDSPNAKCTAWGANKLCPTKPKNAADNQYFRRCRGNQEYCYINDCIDGYLPNEDHDRCVLDRKSGECAPENNNNVRYAKWRKRNGKYMCIIIECVRGYEPNDAGTACIAKIVLPEDKSKARINELQGVYDKAKKNEMSDANKILGGASMGATGAGGMMLGMGLAEQKADNAAYEQMRGYVSTFKCNYGANNVEYSVEPTQLPTSTELTNLYAEYVTLANDLKMRKSVLGLRAGLESQPILDSATSGLYDDVSSGRATGTFTSLARAILDPDGEDAKRWAEQTKKSKNLIIAGGVTAGVGAVGGIVGNLLINKDAPNLQSVREDINGINKRYEEFYEEFETEPEPEEEDVHPNSIVTYTPSQQIDEEPAEEVSAEDPTPELTPVVTANAGKITLTIPTPYVIDSIDKYIYSNFIPNLLNLFSDFKIATNLPEPINVTVDVYTDTDDTDENKQRLSQDQAMNIRNELLRKAEERGLTLNVTAKGHGKENCTCAAGLNNQDTRAMRLFRTWRTAEALCPTDSTYADLARIKIPDNTNFPYCNRIEISVTVPDIESFKYDYDITGFDSDDPVILPYWDEYENYWPKFPPIQY